MNRKKLTKAEEFYIKANPENLSVEDLAKEFDRPKSMITKVKGVNPTEEHETETVTKIKRVPSQVQNLMGKARNKGKIVGAVMTEAASSLSDSLRKKSGISRVMRESTTKIYD